MLQEKEYKTIKRSLKQKYFKHKKKVLYIYVLYLYFIYVFKYLYLNKCFRILFISIASIQLLRLSKDKSKVRS